MIVKLQNKKYIFSFNIVLCLLIAGCQTSGYIEPKYPIGKDTIKFFGDTTFQIQKDPTGDHVLIKEPKGSVVDKHIYAYKQIENLVYTWGKRGYTIVNLDTYQVKQFRDYNGYTKEEIKNFFHKKIDNLILLDKFTDFTEEERKVFEDLMKQVENTK